MSRMLIAMAACAALAAAGCGGSGGTGAKDDRPEKKEAELFGYKGFDLESATNTTFLAMSAGVTNWLPERVLSVCEKYDFTPDEEKAFASAGVQRPSFSSAALPEGYSPETEGPWLSVMTRPAEAFGYKGVSGFLAHFDEEKGLWQAGESYFSSYWDSEEKARAALEAVKTQFASSFAPKKIYPFDGCWVAEYLRTAVVACAGLKEEGKWSCMIAFYDKCDGGCGQWESVEAQQERRDAYEYSKALAAWKKASAGAFAANSAAIASALSAAGLAGFPEARDLGKDPAGMPVRGLFGDDAPVEEGVPVEDAARSLFAKLAGDAAKAIGTTGFGEPSFDSDGDRAACCFAETETDLFKARIDVLAFMPPPEEPPDESAPEVEAAEAPAAPEAAPGEAAPAAGGAEIEKPAAAPRAVSRWRILFVEKKQPGIDFPQKPARKSAAE